MLTEEISLDSSTEDVMSIVEEVGKSLGYRVSSRQKYGDFTALKFKRETSPLVEMVTDYMRTVSVTVMHYPVTGTHNPNEQKLTLIVSVLGTYGEGTKADVQKALEAFKDKLQESLSTRTQVESAVESES